MNLAVVSHKLCWESELATSGYGTDGGFPVQMAAISELFSSTVVVVPCSTDIAPEGISDLSGENVAVCSLPMPKGTGLRRKINMGTWALQNFHTIWKQVQL